jgi:prepilin peptidase CpaA
MLFGLVEFRAVMTGAVLVVVAIAAREDLLRQRIPNYLTASALVLGVGMACLSSGWGGFLDSVGGALVGFAAFIPFYLLRGMGAGDVKLMAACGAFLGPSNALFAAASALVAGLVLALTIVAWRLVEPRPRFETTPPAAGAPAGRADMIATVRKQRFPYAVAIGTGVVASLWRQGALGGFFAALGMY